MNLDIRDIASLVAILAAMIGAVIAVFAAGRKLESMKADITAAVTGAISSLRLEFLTSFTALKSELQLNAQKADQNANAHSERIAKLEQFKESQREEMLRMRDAMHEIRNSVGHSTYREASNGTAGDAGRHE